MKDEDKKSVKLGFTKVTLLNLKVRTGIEAGVSDAIGCTSNKCGIGTSSFHQGASGCLRQ